MNRSYATFWALIAMAWSLGLALARPGVSQVGDGTGGEARGMIDVRVTAADGPVAGLSAAAFRLRVDNRRTAIESVREIDEGAPMASDYLIFVDDVFCMPARRNEMLDRLEEGLTALGPDDRVALIAYDGEAATVLSGWTRSHQHLRQAFAAARARPAQGPTRLAEKRQLDAALRTAEGGGAATSFSSIGLRGSTRIGTMSAIGMRRVRALTAMVAGVLDAAAAGIEALPPSSGRPVLLLLAGGWQLAPESWVLEATADGGPYGGVVAAKRLTEDLIAAADRGGFAVYPLPVPTWAPDLAPADASRSVRQTTSDALVEELLVDLADETGGRALGGDDNPLAAAVGDGQAFYRLTFAVEQRRDGRRRAVDLDLAARTAGVHHIQARRGLADPSVEQDRSRQARVAKLFGAAAVGGAQAGTAARPPRRSPH